MVSRLYTLEEARRRASVGLVALALVAQAVAVMQVATDEAEAAFADQFVWPMSGKITSIHWECRASCARYHRAIDIADGCDNPIYAARAGVVSLVAYDEGGYGNYVKVNHDHGYETLYAHMSSVSVSQGASVGTSTILGYEGSTGASTGCHLHFEVRQDDNGAAVDLKQFIPGRINDQVTRGAAVPYAMQLYEVTAGTSVLDGPNVHDVSGQGDVSIGSAQTGERYVAYSSWTNGAGETWRALSFNGRIGWIRSDHLASVAGDALRVTTDGALNVRSGPGATNADVGDVWGGQEYRILASQADSGGATWHKIHYDGSDGAGTGWVHSSYTTGVEYGNGGGGGGNGNLEGQVIVVDPGHGGSDPGASGFGLDEKEVVLDIGLRLRDLLEADGATVLMTRTTDATVSLSARVAIANDADADRFVSVHANSCGSCGGHGTETYYHESLPSTSVSADLAGDVQEKVVAYLGTRDRGVKTADFHVLRETNMPAILVETAFIDHEGDNAKLASPTDRQEFARAILHGIQVHFGLEPHDPGTTPPPPPPEPEPGFFDDFEGADPGWSAANDGGSASWALTTARSSSATHSRALRDYGASENDKLTTPTVDLAGLTDPTLTLKSWMQGEQSCFLFSCSTYDYGRVEVSSDGGASWRVLKDKYWSSGGAWEELSFSLSSEAEKKVKVRFTFVSDGATQNEGWYVDDVRVSGSESEPPPPPPPPPPSEGFFDDFEGADPGWTTEDDGGSAKWALTTARSASSSHSRAIRDYGAGENDRLVSPVIDLAGITTPTLTLKSWMQGEQSCFLFSCSTYDYGRVEVSSDGGASWRVLKDKYWSSGGAWETLSLDLSAEEGDQVRLRFTFVSDGSTENEGWYVDDVRVE